jgi:hypothetical protein
MLLPCTHAYTPPGPARNTHTHMGVLRMQLLQILASEAGATLPGVNEENQLSFLTQLCDAYVEVSRRPAPTAATASLAAAWQTNVFAGHSRKPVPHTSPAKQGN